MLTPDDIAAGAAVSGPVLVYDDDHYFMGGALAEKLRRDGHEVTLATAAPIVSSWTQMTDEQAYIEARLAELGVGMLTRHQLQSVERGGAVLDHLGSRRPIPYGTLVLVTGRSAETALLDVLKARDGRTAGIKSITAIGDALSPSSIADAVFAGHRYARRLDSEGPEVVGRERPLSSNTRLDP